MNGISVANLYEYKLWFIIDCGAIVSLTWIKGGDNQIYSSEGLPLEINVTMEVEDLYPTSMSSKIMTYVKYNRNLLCFLENMAGVSVTQLSAKTFKAAFIESKLALYVSSIMDKPFSVSVTSLIN